jgi:hypothetical protein
MGHAGEACRVVDGDRIAAMGECAQCGLGAAQCALVPGPGAAVTRASPPSSTATFSAGARSHSTNRETCSTLASSNPTPTRCRKTHHSFKLVAYARTVADERSSACRCARYASAGGTGTP